MFFFVRISHIYLLSIHSYCFRVYFRIQQILYTVKIIPVHFVMKGRKKCRRLKKNIRYHLIRDLVVEHVLFWYLCICWQMQSFILFTIMFLLCDTFMHRRLTYHDTISNSGESQNSWRHIRIMIFKELISYQQKMIKNDE